MVLAYKASYKPEGMYGKETFCSTVLKAYEKIAQWHEDSEAFENGLTAYRGYYNRFKNRNIKVFSDVLEGDNGTVHVFEIEEIEIN